MGRKLVASIAIVLGSVEAIVQACVVFGLDISPDQHTAIAVFTGICTALLGVWIHPDLPGGAALGAPPAGPDPEPPAA